MHISHDFYFFLIFLNYGLDCCCITASPNPNPRQTHQQPHASSFTSSHCICFLSPSSTITPQQGSIATLPTRHDIYALSSSLDNPRCPASRTGADGLVSYILLYHLHRNKAYLSDIATPKQTRFFVQTQAATIVSMDPSRARLCSLARRKWLL